jgi:hypothetical protein
VPKHNDIVRAIDHRLVPEPADPGNVVADLAVTLALGGDCLADIAILRIAPELFGPIASNPTVSRLINALLGRKSGMTVERTHSPALSLALISSRNVRPLQLQQPAPRNLAGQPL